MQTLLNRGSLSHVQVICLYMSDLVLDNKVIESSVGKGVCIGEGGEMLDFYDGGQLIKHEVDGNLKPLLVRNLNLRRLP